MPSLSITRQGGRDPGPEINRLSHIEGLRAYLALWVVVDHLLGSSGYAAAALRGSLRFLRQGWYAVDVFIVISGFVIFYLLDRRREAYRVFILRRFFRLWPLFIVLFGLAIPISKVTESNLQAFSALYPGVGVGSGHVLEKLHACWQRLPIHVALHLPMLHGIVPDAVLPHAPSAFLGPAWSISLEWQFYLIAPLVFGFLASAPRWSVPVVSAAALGLSWIGRRIPEVEYGAFLPMHADFFFLGCFSFYAFGWVRRHSPRVPVFPLGVALATFLHWLSGRNPEVMPVCLWIGFFFLLVDLQLDDRPWYVVGAGWLFSNRVVQHLGKISYSIYLGHGLVLILGQWVVLRFLPGLSQGSHLAVLSLVVLPVTVGVAHVLYRTVEAPGIAWGKRFVESAARSRS